MGKEDVPWYRKENQHFDTDGLVEVSTPICHKILLLDTPHSPRQVETWTLANTSHATVNETRRLLTSIHSL